MNKIKIISAIILIAINCNTIFSQAIEGGKLDNQTIRRMPLGYDKKPDGTVLPESAKRETKGEGTWFVYSDREGNSTYFDKNCTKPNIRLNYMEPLVVAAETDDAVRVVRFDVGSALPFREKNPGKKTEFVFQPNADDVGWIKKKNLLLWSYSIVNDSTKYTKKAISVKKLDNKKGGVPDIASIIQKGILDLYNYPEESPKNKAGKDITLFQYLFVYKYDADKKLYLVGKESRIKPGAGVSDIMLGWAPERQLQIWDNAVCLRINFDPEAVAERKQKNIEVTFFSDINSAKGFRDGKSAVGLPFIYDDPGKEENKKDNPYFFGFPIVDKDIREPNIYKTGYVTQTMNRQGKRIFSASKQAEINEDFENIKKSLLQVNIVFVVDGSQRNVMKSMAQAIQNMALFDNSSTKNKYKLGAVIYNDEKCENNPFKVFSLSSSKDKFIDNLIDEANAQPPCELNRSENGAPLYAALRKGSDLFDNAKETNLIVLIGTTSDPNKENQQSALKALTSKAVKLTLFQSLSKDGDLYDRFVKDCKYFLEENAKFFDNKYFKDEITSGKRKAVKLIPSDNFSYLENAGTPGSFTWVDPGEILKPNDISKKVQKILKDNENAINGIVERFEGNTTGAQKGVKEGAGEENEEETKQLMALLKSLNYSDSDIEQISNVQNYQLFIEAYTTIKNKNLSEELLTRTLFMSQREYQNLIEIFEKLEDNYSTSNNRTNVVATYRNIILQYKGGDGTNLDNNATNSFTMNDFMKLVTGLSGISQNPLFKKSLVDIENPKKTSDDEIAKLKTAFFNINKQLKEVKKNKSYLLVQDDGLFYWIPEKVFHVDL